MDPGFVLREAENIQKHPCLISPTFFGFGHSRDKKVLFYMPLLGILAWQKLEDVHRELAAFMTKFETLTTGLSSLSAMSLSAPDWCWTWVALTHQVPGYGLGSL